MDSRADNPEKIVALGGSEYIQAAGWSPDGHRLAYIRGQRTSGAYDSAASKAAEAAEWSIEICDLNGANRTVLLSTGDLPLDDLYWLADGRIVYSRLESLDSRVDQNLWQVGVDERTGKPDSKPKRITQWVGSAVWGLRATADGKQLVVQKMTLQDQVYMGELAADGASMKSIHRLSNDEANELPFAWTPDSEAVLYTSDRGGRQGIFKQGFTEDTPQPVVTGPKEVSAPLVSPDNDWLLYLESAKRSSRLMRIPISGGPPQFVLETRGWPACARAPASLCVIFDESQDQKEFTITAFDPLKGIGRLLRKVPEHSSGELVSALSPDGGTFAISQRFEPEIHIRTFSLSGASDSEINVTGWPNTSALAWSADGNGLYCGSVSAQGLGVVLYVDRKGNSRVVWQHKGAINGGQVWGIPSPNGRYLAILAEVNNSNVWMLEGF
jgi:hypothetical protein